MLQICSDGALRIKTIIDAYRGIDKLVYPCSETVHCPLSELSDIEENIS